MRVLVDGSACVSTVKLAVRLVRSIADVVKRATIAACITGIARSSFGDRVAEIMTVDTVIVVVKAMLDVAAIVVVGVGVVVVAEESIFVVVTSLATPLAQPLPSCLQHHLVFSRDHALGKKNIQYSSAHS